MVKSSGGRTVKSSGGRTAKNITVKVPPKRNSNGSVSRKGYSYTRKG